MKRILVVNSDVPFVDGGHRTIARCLADAIEQTGYACEVWNVPQNRFGRQLSAYAAARLTDVSLSGDLLPVDGVISLKYPSYAVRHPRHVCWMVHRMREYYDLWDEFRARLSWQGRRKEGVRRFLMHRLDNWLLRNNVSRLFAISRTVKERLGKWGGHSAFVLHAPPPARAYRAEAYEGFLFAYSRLDRLKRFDLLLRTLAQAGPLARLKIAGVGPEKANLEALARDLNLGGRVQFLGRLSEQRLLEELARCRAVWFAPYNEDHGFVTLEAFSSSKPVITALDSGGPLEFVKDEETGLVAGPDPGELAGKVVRILEDEPYARELGARASASIKALTWENTVRVLVDGLGLGRS